MTIDNDQPVYSLYDRSIPVHIAIDVDGLVDAWTMEAEDWLVAYDGPDALTDREAFEGIENLARLCRCRPEIRNQQNVKSVVGNLLATLQPIASTVLQRAIRYPDLAAWRIQVQEAWELDDDFPETAETLLADLDAADWIPWFASVNADQPIADDLLDRYLAELGECHALLGQKLVMFCAAEAYIRAVGKTVTDNLDLDDNGWLASSGWKYIRLLNELDVDIEAVSEESRRLVLGLTDDPRSPDRLDQTAEVATPIGNTSGFVERAMGPQESVWRAQEAAFSLAAAIPSLPAIDLGLRWRDPKGIYEAEVTWPKRLDSGGDKMLELLFGTGEHFMFAPYALDGQQVRLGNATGLIQISGEGEDTKASVDFRYSNVTVGLVGELRLHVAGTQWIFCDGD